MGLDIDRLIGNDDDVGMKYPRRLFKIGYDKMRKRGKLADHGHKESRSAFKNSRNKRRSYVRDRWDDEDVDDDLMEWHYRDEANDLPDFSYPDYKPSFGLRDHLGDSGLNIGEGLDMRNQVAEQAHESWPSGEMKNSTNNQENSYDDSHQKQSWFSNFINKMF